MMQVLVTRPEPDATAQAELLRSRGLKPVIAPLLFVTLLPLARDVASRASNVAATIATSRNALRSLGQHGCPERLKSRPLFCVGPATAQLANDLGFANVIEGEGTAADVQRSVVSYVKPEDGPVLRLTGDTPSMAPECLDAALQAAGYDVETVACYRIDVLPEFAPDTRVALSSGVIDLVILMSPLTARTYLKAHENAALTLRSDKPRYLCLSQAVADSLVGVSTEQLFVASKPNRSGLLSVIDQAVANLS